MISYEKITGYNKNKEGVKCMICNHYYFEDSFDYQPYVCNKCYDFSITVMDLSDFYVYIIKIMTIESTFLELIKKKL